MHIPHKLPHYVGVGGGGGLIKHLEETSGQRLDSAESIGQIRLRAASVQEF